MSACACGFTVPVEALVRRQTASLSKHFVVGDVRRLPDGTCYRCASTADSDALVDALIDADVLADSDALASGARKRTKTRCAYFHEMMNTTPIQLNEVHR